LFEGALESFDVLTAKTSWRWRLWIPQACCSDEAAEHAVRKALDVAPRRLAMQQKTLCSMLKKKKNDKPTIRILDIARTELPSGTERGSYELAVISSPNARTLL
jgi:hypothetical protein